MNAGEVGGREEGEVRGLIATTVLRPALRLNADL